MDTCLSIYQRLFSQGHHYAYELGELADYYNRYSALMNHWEPQLRDASFNCNYENLVRQPSAIVAEVLAHCGLDFEPACLDFEAGTGVVTTASASQVRQPLHTNSIGRWRHYGEQLKPLQTALLGNL